MTYLFSFLDSITNALIYIIQNDFFFAASIVFPLFAGFVVLFRKFVRGF